MAKPVCAKCGHEFFSASEVEVIGLKKRVTMVFCGRCGAALSIVDNSTILEPISQLQERLEDIEFKISNFIK